MPRASRRCPGDNGNCTNLIRGGDTYCADHLQPWQSRTASSRITMTHAWRVLRPEILRRDRYQCQIRGPHCTGHATVVDKIEPVARRPDLALDPANLRAACAECNGWKAQAEAAAGRTAWKRQPEPHPGLTRP